MICRSLLRSGWVLLLGAVGLLGCMTGPAPGEDEPTVQTSEDLSLAGICGGPRGLLCPRTAYCQTPANTCPGPKQFGLCRTRPQICPNVFIPVCGCDGKTYPNSCQAARAGTSVAHTGACAPPACTSNADCAAGNFCQQPAGQCGGTGTCTAEPQICPDIFNPVCGCDGKTYPNSCNASAAGVNVASTGQCPAQQFCGGIAAIPCPGAGKCVDNSNDSCDPNNGGADCGGICVCIENQLCVIGSHFDSSPQVCACVPDATPQFCGGIAAIPCPGAGRCVDDPNDNCDPNNGGADCGGICTCIETQLCIIGSHFDSSPQVCACVPDAATM